MENEKSNNWDKVDCEELEKMIVASRQNLQLKDLTEKQKEAIFPKMRPTKDQRNVAKIHVRNGGLKEIFDAINVLPSTFLPAKVRNSTLAMIWAENCMNKEHRESEE
jgi:hypothetical protein